MIASIVQKLGKGISDVRWPVIENTRRTRQYLSVLGVVLLLVSWEAVTAALRLNPQYFPGPTDVVAELARIWEIVLGALPETVMAASVGFLISLGLSVAVAMLLVANERILRALMPFIIGMNTVPRIAMTPLVIYWVAVFGILGGNLVVANYIMAVWVAFFPMLIAALDGFRDIDEATENMLEIYGATTWQEFKYFRFKNAYPFIFDGMKTGFILAMIGAVVGEFISRSGGVGSIAATAIGRTSVSRAFAVVLLLGFVSTGVVLAIYLLEKRVIHWQDASFMGGDTA